jgi:hypothetical protein
MVHFKKTSLGMRLNIQQIEGGRMNFQSISSLMTDTDNSGQQMLCNLDLRRKDTTECRHIRKQ